MSRMPAVEPRMVSPEARALPTVLDDRQASVAIEYALLGAVMALVALGSFALFGTSAGALWQWLSSELVGAMPP